MKLGGSTHPETGAIQEVGREPQHTCGTHAGPGNHILNVWLDMLGSQRGQGAGD